MRLRLADALHRAIPPSLTRNFDVLHPLTAASIDFLFRQPTEQFAIFLLLAAARLHFLASERACHLWRSRKPDASYHSYCCEGQPLGHCSYKFHLLSGYSSFYNWSRV